MAQGGALTAGAYSGPRAVGPAQRSGGAVRHGRLGRDRPPRGLRGAAVGCSDGVHEASLVSGRLLKRKGPAAKQQGPYYTLAPGRSIRLEGLGAAHVCFQ